MIEFLHAMYNLCLILCGDDLWGISMLLSGGVVCRIVTFEKLLSWWLIEICARCIMCFCDG